METVFIWFSFTLNFHIKLYSITHINLDVSNQYLISLLSFIFIQIFSWYLYWFVRFVKIEIIFYCFLYFLSNFAHFLTIIKLMIAIVKLQDFKFRFSITDSSILSIAHSLSLLISTIAFRFPMFHWNFSQ